MERPAYLAETEPAPDLVSRSEIGEMVGVNRQRVHQIVTGRDFPPPAIVVSSHTLWWRADVAAWIAATAQRRAMRRPA